MAVHGYVTHAARNRRFTALLVCGYILAFELIGAFILATVLLIVDPAHMIFSNPGGYAVRYGLPVAALSGLLFRHLYRGHAKAVTNALCVRIVARDEEPRFVAIGEEACTTLGVRVPRFGVIETPAPNALTVGDGPARGLIVVTRGLLERLDDDELLAVLAHETSHIRQGDTALLAANHALMRTAVLLQVNNPLRFEDWRQMMIPLLIPPMMVVMLAGGAATMAAMTLARWSRRGLKLGRDYRADGEAVRVTHFPEALLSALAKVGGRGGFQGSLRVEGLLFDGPADHEGGSHPAIDARRQAIAALGAGLVNPMRSRRDTRGAVRPRFGQTASPAAMLYPADAAGRPFEQPPTPTLRMRALRYTDPDAYRQWREAAIAWYEWRVTDRRNVIGLAPAMVLPVAATAIFLLVFWWPSDGDLGKLAARLGPGALVEMARETNSGPTCEGPSFHDGLCPEYSYSPAQIATKHTMMARKAEQEAADLRAQASPSGGHLDLSGMLVPLIMVVTGMLALFRPSALRWLFGVVDRKPMPPEPCHHAGPVAQSERPSAPVTAAAAGTGSARGSFGRKLG